MRWWLALKQFSAQTKVVSGMSRNWRKTVMKPWALPPWWTVSVLSTMVRLPCWSRHCCFLYWPQLLMASSPLPCCHPGWLGQSLETPSSLVVDIKKEGRRNKAVMDSHVSTWGVGGQDCLRTAMSIHHDRLLMISLNVCTSLKWSFLNKIIFP